MNKSYNDEQCSHDKKCYKQTKCYGTDKSYDMEKCNSVKQYACAYILPQSYENLFSVKEALSKGTIFEDLYQPYDSKSNRDII